IPFARRSMVEQIPGNPAQVVASRGREAKQSHGERSPKTLQVHYPIQRSRWFPCFQSSVLHLDAEKDFNTESTENFSLYTKTAFGRIGAVRRSRGRLRDLRDQVFYGAMSSTGAR